MFCDRCGANLQGPVSFCPHCGRQFGAAPQLPVGNRVSGHLRNVAVLWLVYSALRVLPGLFLNCCALDRARGDVKSNRRCGVQVRGQSVGTAIGIKSRGDSGNSRRDIG